MWLKLPGDHFIDTEDCGQLYPGRDEAGYGAILFASGVTLLRFHSVEAAAESLVNLFMVWARNRTALFLIPEGNTWVLPDLNVKKGVG